MAKHALVTGGAGFIGSHVAAALVDKGYRVTILDDLSTGKMKNILDLVRNTSVEFVKGSILDTALLGRVSTGVDYVFHLAAIPSVPRSIENPRATHDVNVNGTLNMLVAARDNGVKKVVYSSSSSVYGDTPRLPKKEDMIPEPLSPYAVSKLTGEYYCRVFNLVYNLRCSSLRYFNVFGPHQDPESEYAAVIPRFIKRISRGEPPVIFGDGEQTRDFTFVKDVAVANLKAAESGACGIFNIAGGKNISINNLAELINRLLGKNIKAEYKPARAGDVKHSLADITAAAGFGFRPEYDLEAGLKETIRWFNEK